MLVLWSTLGRCWMVSCVRGETGECWWLWEWEDERLLDCSVPGESTRKGFFSSLPNSPNPAFHPAQEDGLLPSLPGLQMGACSTVVEARMDFSRSLSRSRSRSRSRSDTDDPDCLVMCVGPPETQPKGCERAADTAIPLGNSACSSHRCVCRVDKEWLHPRSPEAGQTRATSVTKPRQIMEELSWHRLQGVTFHRAVCFEERGGKARKPSTSRKTGSQCLSEN